VAKKQEVRQESAVVTMESEREKTIALLSEQFAQDIITLDELEKRIEAAYRAPTLSSLRDLTRDLPGGTPAAESGSSSLAPAPQRSADVAEYPVERERIASIMSETKRTGAWRPARKMSVFCLMSETTLDLTQAVLQPGVTEISLFALMASVKVIVPQGVRVVLQADAMMATVSDETVDPPAVGSGAPVIRITGNVIMSELVARMRLRELSGGDA
jgi:hypothetical protein